MSSEHLPEKRNFIRIQAKLPVRYRFLRRGKDGPEPLALCDGESTNLSGGGLLLVGPVPDMSWIGELLMEKIVLWVEIHLVPESLPVRALTRVAWLEGLDEATRVSSMGLKFKEITREAQDRILDYIIESTMPP